MTSDAVAVDPGGDHDLSDKAQVRFRVMRAIERNPQASQRDLARELGVTSYQIAADYDAILRWFWTGGITAAYVPDVLVKMRVGGESNRSLGRIITKSREDYRALRSNGVGGIGALAWKNMSKLPQFIKK